MPDDFNEVMDRGVRFQKKLNEEAPLIPAGEWVDISDETLRQAGAKSYQVKRPDYLVTIGKYPAQGRIMFSGMAAAQDGLFMPVGEALAKKLFEIADSYEKEKSS